MTAIQEILKLESELTLMFDSDERVAITLLEYIRANRKQLLDKEKEMIIDAWIDDRFPLDLEWIKKCAEQYYNETYGGNK